MELHDLVSEWLRYSKTDLDVAKQLYECMHPRPLEIICYHAQQSAEKALKAVLISNNVMVPKTHDMNKLREMCSEYDSSFSEITTQCSSLHPYSIMPRYLFEIEILDSDAEIAISKSTEIYDWITLKISDNIEKTCGNEAEVS